jgi:DNA-binding winged helix-turn-helix (wHTH) protein/TolB-like protein
MAIVRFGLFTFDPDTLELQREGLPVRLQAQPAQVLAALLATPGELVTRESLRQTVWGDGTFVDFDRGLNFCIAQIRSALGDSADSPRYIRTVPKRGYQFIAPAQAGVPDGVAAVPNPTIPRRRIWPLWAAGVLLILAAGGVFGWRRVATPPKVRVAVVHFDNETGRPALDRFAQDLSDTLVGELTTAGGDRLGVIGNAAILRQPRGKRDLREIARSLDASYVILGQVQSGGKNVRVLAHLIRMPEQTHLKVIRTDIGAVDALETELNLGRQIAGEFSARIRAASSAAASR